MKPAAVDEWLEGLRRRSGPNDGTNAPPALLSPKSRGHIKAMLYRLMEKAMFWELVPLARNPIGLVEIKGVSKRSKRPYILTVKQFDAVCDGLLDPYKQMVQVAICWGCV